MSRSFLLLVIPLIVTSCNSMFAQEININSLDIHVLDSSRAENVLYDVNGELCSIAFFETDYEGVKFYTNRGVEKISKTNNGYRIFFPSSAANLKISIPGFSLLEYALPASEHSHSVYIFKLFTISEQRFVYSDTLRPFLSISTEPQKANIYIEGQKIGKSPIIIEEPDLLNFSYSIKKRGFGTIYGTHNTEDKGIINHSMKDLRREKNLFITYHLGVGDPNNGDFGRFNGETITGLTIGFYGKTGFFINSGHRKVEVPYEYTAVNILTEKFRRISFYVGPTQQITNNFYLFAGLGFLSVKAANLDYYYSGMLQVPYLKEVNESSIGFCGGLNYRIAWRFLVHLEVQYSPTISMSVFQIGLGINLGPVKRD